ncbi:MAG TPA: addiction module protein [Candidatus Angelobacter sp.]|nr:addiction module protein [Candidatus Angelobacter sp.]
MNLNLKSSGRKISSVTHQDAWKDEIARRIRDLDSGIAKTVSWDEVQRRIAAKLKNGSKLRKNNRSTR